MTTPKIIMELDPPRAWTETVVRGVSNHNIAATGLPQYYPVGFFIKDAAGAVRGGLLGDIWGGWLQVWSLWVDHKWRGRGYATGLMAAAEEYAITKNCTNTHLRTGSYEARPFYERLGYRLWAELSDHPIPGHSRYLMSKSLAEGPITGPRDVRGRIVMDSYPSAELQGLIRRGISLHAAASLGLPEQVWSSVNFFLRTTDGEIVGGALGDSWGRWFYLDFMWVDTPHRGRGYATKLIDAAERRAIANGCTDAGLGTFSFQARPLYEKLGYRVFGELKDFPKGHSLYFLARKLVKDKPNRRRTGGKQ
ncbi:MAG: GNAT family N-acetyltransferase [Candidatus Binataceae bacterium]